MARLPCKDLLKWTCTTPFFEKWHLPECLFYKSENGCKFWYKCSHAHRQVDEQPSKKCKKEWWQNCSGSFEEYMTVGLQISGYGAAEVFIDSADELKHTDQSLCVTTTFETKNHRLGVICPGDPHQRNPNAPKFEDPSQEETERQERDAHEAAWKMARCVLTLKEKHKTTFFSPSKNWCLPSPSRIIPEEREFVVDSGASMHMISKKDLNSAEGLQFVSESWITFLTMKLHEDTPAVPSLGKLCDEHGHSCEWINGQKPHLIKMVFEYSVIRKISYQSWFLVYLQLPQARLLQHPRHLQVKKMIIQITIQQSSQVKMWIENPYTAEIPEELIHEVTEITKPKIKWGSRTGTAKPIFRHTRMVARIQRESDGWKSSSTQRFTREFFSWTIFRTDEKCGFGSAQCLYSLPKWPKLRDLPEDQNHKGPVQKTHRQSPTSCRKFWWFDYSRSSVKDVNLETIVDMQSLCKTWLPNGSSRIHAKQKLLWKHTRACKSSWSRMRSPKSFNYIVRHYHTDQRQMGLLREQCAEWKKVRLLYCRNQEKWEIVRRFHGLLLLSAKHSRSLVWWEDTIWKTLWKTFSKAQLSRLVHWLSITLPLQKTSQESMRGRIWGGDINGCRRWGLGNKWTHQKSTQKDSMQWQ